MAVTTEVLITELNKDLEWEFTVAVQYVQHAAPLTGARYDAIKSELIIHSQEELQHAVMLAEQIDFLGGVATINVEERNVANDARDMLQQDLVGGEDNAICRYKERIAQAEALQEYGLRRVIEDILIQEEEHKRDLLDALG
ncbi:MAG: ferritin-like domain-containing protein [Gammaproteobacteria bacterium]|nr:ferritin-like domain-containing protein [Gammaproteobacteria bacterium]